MKHSFDRKINALTWGRALSRFSDFALGSLYCAAACLLSSACHAQTLHDGRQQAPTVNYAPMLSYYNEVLFDGAKSTSIKAWPQQVAVKITSDGKCLRNSMQLHAGRPLLDFLNVDDVCSPGGGAAISKRAGPCLPGDYETATACIRNRSILDIRLIAATDFLRLRSIPNYTEFTGTGFGVKSDCRLFEADLGPPNVAIMFFKDADSQFVKAVGNMKVGGPITESQLAFYRCEMKAILVMKGIRGAGRLANDDMFRAMNWRVTELMLPRVDAPSTKKILGHFDWAENNQTDVLISIGELILYVGHGKRAGQTISVNAQDLASLDEDAKQALYKYGGWTGVPFGPPPAVPKEIRFPMPIAPKALR